MQHTLSDHLSSEELKNIRNPIESALTLPASAFLDDAFYKLEVEQIYKKNWIAALFDFDVINPGDLLPFTVCEIPLLAVRSNDDELRIFHNICPYDGCLAVIDPISRSSEIVTPYHGWTYDLEGKLSKTPYWDGSREGNLDALAGKEVDLIPVVTATFMNTVFIHLSDPQIPFEDYIAPIRREMSEYDLKSSQAGSDEHGNPYVKAAPIHANWKTVFENACINVLHESFVHTLYDASPEVPRIKEDGVPSFRNITDQKFMALSYDRLDFQETYPPLDVPHLGKDPNHEPDKETFGTLYPNFYLSASSQFIEVGYVLPNGPGESLQRVIYHYQKDVAVSEEAKTDRQAVADGFYGAFLEDGRICEAIQKARHSPVYRQKFYAPFWDKMHHYFTNLIVDDLTAD
ncbi:MAG TPA: hypothetical protein EYF99_09445 [Pseudomonadales bacterium]|nr:hypothetical protein [Pseudomonadales bacterium]